ncbi:MAG: YdcF family protein [Prevotella sp.]|jgi:SanA protein|nr:YdcF family protein [Prevotella sp.]
MESRTKNILKRTIYILLAVIVIITSVIVFANWKIPHDTKEYVFDDTENIPEQKVALVLGTVRYTAGGENQYFTYRIRAAKELYEAGKVKAFVLSGDNSRKSYNEPDDMRKALIEAGIPENIIHLDYAGFRTLDSVVRMSEVFGQDSFIIVSQQFHNERAIFLAQYYGLEAYGYNAKDLELNRFSFKTKAREVLARVKVFVDIITNKKPKFLGEPINID